jgi:hypothetical protein
MFHSVFGTTYTKNLFIAYLKFIFNMESGISPRMALLSYVTFRFYKTWIFQIFFLAQGRLSEKLRKSL